MRKYIWDWEEAWEEDSRRRWRWYHWVLLVFGVGSVATLAGVVIAGLVVYAKLTKGLPDVAELETYQPSLITEVYDRHEQLIAEFYIERRRLVPLSEVPLHVRQATIAAEDSRFYTHKGVDFFGVLRAIVANLRAGRTREGASTITQQVARNLFLTHERTMERKIREAILAYRIEKRYSKDQILQIYLNQIFYGHNAYGIEAAAQLYFRKSVQELTLAEGALIAALPPAPNVYSPLNNPSLSLQRRQHVLQRMVEEKYLTPEAALAAADEPLQLGTVRLTRQVNKAPYFVEEIRQYLEDKYGPNQLYRGGLTIYTTLDLRLQRAAERALRHGLFTVDKRVRQGVYSGPVEHLELTADAEANTALIEAVALPFGSDPTLHNGDVLPGVVLDVQGSEVTVQVKAVRGVIAAGGFPWRLESQGSQARRREPWQFLRRGDVIVVRVLQVGEDGQGVRLSLEQEPLVQGAMLVLEVASGHVLAMVGGYDFAHSQFNRAVQAQRQVGSAFKPVIYAAAIEAGMSPTSIVADRPIVRAVPGSDTWVPSNYDKKFLGPISIRTALKKSRNLATVDLLEKVGVKKVCVYAKRLGIRSPLPCYPSLALGSAGVTLLEMTAVFGVFANGGIYAEPTLLAKVADRYGQPVEERWQNAQRVMSPAVAYVVTSMLESVVQEGTGQRVKALERPAAGKTGTTNDFVDAWFIGYTPELIAGVWVGLDTHKTLGRRETGGRVASPIWLEFMQEILEGQPRVDFPIPPGVRFVNLGDRSGLPQTPWTLSELAHFEVVVDDAEAAESNPEHRGITATETKFPPDRVSTTTPVTPQSSRFSRRELNRLDRLDRSR